MDAKMDAQEAAQQLDRKIEQWKSDLIDVSGRNPLLNFKPTQTNSLRLLEPLTEIAGRLLADEPLDAEALRTPYRERCERLERQTYEPPSNDNYELSFQEQWQHREEWEQNLKARIDEQYGGLSKILTKLRNQARTAMNEQGINTSYLTFGLLHWKPVGTADSLPPSRAPLFLMPVTLRKFSAETPFTLSPYEREIIFNPFMNHVLEEQFGMTLTDLMFDPEQPDFTQAFEQIHDKIKRLPGWEIEEDCLLALFSFNKLGMYEDLDHYRSLLERHPLIRELAGAASEDEQLRTFDVALIPDAASLDRDVPARDSFNVVDADSSQQQAILAAKRGLSFVLQGPPGTGKSQTITNIMAECLADGKKVLFVSEKMAALNVVKDRLEARGLGGFCLEMHSHKASKRQVLDVLAEAIHESPPPGSTPVETYRQIDDLRGRLNTYPDKLHEVRPPYGQSAYEVHGLLHALRDVPDMLTQLPPRVESEPEEAERLLGDVERYHRQAFRARFWPWELLRAERFTLELQAGLRGLLEQAIGAAKRMSDLADRCAKQAGLQVRNKGELDQAVSILELASVSPRPPREWITSRDLADLTVQAKRQQKRLDELSVRRSDLLEGFEPDLLELPLANMREPLLVGPPELLELIPADDRLRVLDEGAEDLRAAASAFRSLRRALEQFAPIAEKAGLDKPETLNQYKRLGRYMLLLDLKPKPELSWFDKGHWKSAVREAEQAQEQYGRLAKLRRQASERYDLSAAAWDAGLTIERMQQTLDGLLLLNGGDRAAAGQTLYDQRIEIGQTVNESLAWYERWTGLKAEFENLFELDLGQVPNMRRLAEIMAPIASDPRPERHWFDPAQLPLLGQERAEAQQLAERIAAEEADWNAVYTEGWIDEDGLAQKIESMHTRSLNDYQSRVRRLFGLAYRRDVRELAAMRKDSIKPDFPAFRKEVHALRQALSRRARFEANSPRWSALFGSRFAGLRSDWRGLQQAIDGAEQIAAWYAGRTVPPEVQNLLVSPAIEAQALTDRYRQLEQAWAGMARGLTSLEERYPAIFDPARIPELRSGEYSRLAALLGPDAEQLENFAALLRPAADLRLRRDPGTDESTYAELAEDLNALHALQHLQTELTSQEHQRRDVLGRSFDGEPTRWEPLQDVLAMIGTFHADSTDIPAEIVRFACGPAEDHAERRQRLESTIGRLEQALDLFSNAMPALSWGEAEAEGDSGDTGLLRIEQRMDTFLSDVDRWRRVYDPFKAAARVPFAHFAELRDRFEEALNVQRLAAELEHDMERMRSVFGPVVQGFATDWTRVFTALDWTKRWKNVCGAEAAREPLLTMVCSEETSQGRVVSELATETKHAAAELSDLFAAFEQFLPMSAVFAAESPRTIAWTELDRYAVSRLPHLDLIESSIRYRNATRRARDYGLDSFLEQALPHIGRYKLTDLFLKKRFKQWLDRVYAQEEQLDEFDAERTGEDLDRFRELDLASLDLNVRRIRERLGRGREELLSAPKWLREKQLVLHEIGKKQRHIPIRQLLQQASDFVQALKPCFLMSPLSVSQYLDAHKIGFDLVIFDEASQIFPEDAIGAMLRGKQVIIVGDTKQLPPTNFFRGGGIGEAYDGEAAEPEAEPDYESILDECAALLPTLDLRWHYRSRHESLVAYSNEAFYYDNLITFPGADNGDYLGTDFVYVPDGVYDRGATGTNRVEARRIAELVFEHYRDHAGLSLGVIAFSRKQAETIEEEVQALRRHQPGFDVHFQEDVHEEFFVKSLENVQGDERDVIFLSVGYGPAADGSIYYNFGPLSQAKGERRLNVAVTRAKSHMKLVSSMLPEHLPDAKVNGNSGVKHLKRYMQNILQGRSSARTDRQDRPAPVFDSPVQADIFRVLSELGYTVDTQIGSSKYRIDLGIVHPQGASRYWIGIETDGTAYARSKVARDRDRLRQQVLEGLGWKLYRIRSQAWFKNREREVERLKTYLNDRIKEEERYN